MKPRFDYQRLDVYRAALRFVGWRSDLLHRIPPGHSDTADQLARASTSVVLNIAEGCGEFSGPDRARFFRMARRSAAECGAVLDIFEEIGVMGSAGLEDGRILLERITAMLTALGHRVPESPRRDNQGSNTPPGRLPSR